MVFTLGHLLIRLCCCSSHYIIKIRMSQLRQDQPLKTTVSNIQKSNTLNNSLQGQKAPHQPILSQNQEVQAEFNGCNGLKFQQRDLAQIQPELKCQEWTLEQENLLIQLHNKKGNKWVQIARQLKKKDNQVKNHYHSKLRKTLRKLNKCIQDHLHGQFKFLKNNLISKIVQTAQELYQNKSRQQKQNALKAYQLKNKVLSYAYINQQQITFQQLAQIKKFISQVSEFDHSFKTTQKNEAKTKSGSNKYKGKEILGLLQQNIKTEKVYANARKSTKAVQHPVACIQSSGQQCSQGAQEQNEIRGNSQQKQMANGLGIFGGLPIIFFGQGVLPYQSLFYPVYRQPSTDIFTGQLGQLSSFTSYNPQRQSFTQSLNLTQWPSSTRLEETQYTNSGSDRN